MELLLLLGLMAVIVLAAMGGLAYLRQRRTGTVLAVSRSARKFDATRHGATNRRASSAHR